MSTYDPNRESVTGGDLVRPYLATSGRTASAVEGLQIETLVQSTNKPASVRFEAAKILGMCDRPISIAEIAAHLALPFGTVKVLVGDLITSGNLEAHRTTDGSGIDDVQLITRLISGVKDL